MFPAYSYFRFARSCFWLIPSIIGAELISSVTNNFGRFCSEAKDKMPFSEASLTNTYAIPLTRSISYTRYYYISSFSLSDNIQKDPLLQVHSSLLSNGIPAIWKLGEYTPESLNSTPLGRPTRLFASTKNNGSSPSSSKRVGTPGKRRTSRRLTQKRESQVEASPVIETLEIPDETRIYTRELWIFEFNGFVFNKCDDYPGLARLTGILFGSLIVFRA